MGFMITISPSSSAITCHVKIQAKAEGQPNVFCVISPSRLVSWFPPTNAVHISASAHGRGASWVNVLVYIVESFQVAKDDPVTYGSGADKNYTFY